MRHEMKRCGHAATYRCSCLQPDPEDERYEHEPDVVEQMRKHRVTYADRREER